MIQMDIWVQHTSSGQVVTTQIIVLLENYVRLHGAEKKLFHFLLVVRVHVAQTGIRARQYACARVCVWKKNLHNCCC